MYDNKELTGDTAAVQHFKLRRSETPTSNAVQVVNTNLCGY
jgi:hypothetical protein